MSYCPGPSQHFKWSISEIPSMMVVGICYAFGQLIISPYKASGIVSGCNEVLYWSMLQVFFRQRRLLILALPKDRHNPPALTVVH